MPGDELPNPDDLGGAWGFSRRDAGRISRTVKRVEASVYNRPAVRGRYPVASASGGVLADSGAGVAAGSRATPSSTTGTILVRSGTAGGLTATGGRTVTYYNLSNTAVAASKTIVLSPFLGKLYVVQVLDC